MCLDPLDAQIVERRADATGVEVLRRIASGARRHVTTDHQFGCGIFQDTRSEVAKLLRTRRADGGCGPLKQVRDRKTDLNAFANARDCAER